MEIPILGKTFIILRWGSVYSVSSQASCVLKYFDISRVCLKVFAPFLVAVFDIRKYRVVNSPSYFNGQNNTINSSPPEQNGGEVVNDKFKWDFISVNWLASMICSMKTIHWGVIYKSASVLILARRQTCDKPEMTQLSDTYARLGGDEFTKLTFLYELMLMHGFSFRRAT